LTNETIYTKLAAVFRDIFDDDSIVLHPETAAKDIPEWDSSAHINLIVATELTFGIKFKTAELESLRNVGHFVQVISEKVN
jgi:acyl carrier protein